MAHNRPVPFSGSGPDVCHADAVSTDQSSADGPASSAVVPPSVRIAAIAMGVLAALLLTNAALLGFGYDSAVERIVREAEVSQDAARRFVLTSLIPNVALGFIFAPSAWFLPRRQPWARWTGLAASGLLTLLTLLQMVAAAGATVASLLLLVLSVATVTSLVARTTRDWVPPLRASA